MPRKSVSKKKVVKKAASKKSAKKEPILSLDFKDTSELKVTKGLAGQVIGQELGLDVIKKAAKQYRNVLLIGVPGTGKSMLAQAMSELLPATKLKDILIYPNELDSNEPKVKAVPAGKGKKIVDKLSLSVNAQLQNAQMAVMVIGFILMAALSYAYFELEWYTDVVYAVYLMMVGLFIISMSLGTRSLMGDKVAKPKLLIDNKDKKLAPFIDATGARAGALLGDVRHDPLQSILPSTKLTVGYNKKEVGPLVDSFLDNNKANIKTDNFGYEGVVIPADQRFKLSGCKKGATSECEVMFANRHMHDGEVIKITTESGKELFVTPEHEVAVDIETFKAAKFLKENDEVIIFEDDN